MHSAEDMFMVIGELYMSNRVRGVQIEKLMAQKELLENELHELKEGAEDGEDSD